MFLALVIKIPMHHSVMINHLHPSYSMCFKWSSLVVRSGKLSNQFVPLPFQIFVGKATGSLRQNHLSFPICEGHRNFLVS